MSIVTDFPPIKRKLDRMEQKAEPEAKAAYAWPMFGIPSAPVTPLSSQAHPAWPYTGTPFEWPGF